MPSFCLSYLKTNCYINVNLQEIKICYNYLKKTKEVNLMLRKITMFFFIFVFSILALYANGDTKVSVTLKSASLVTNDHVGNEWGYGAWVNGEEIKRNENKVLEVKDSGTIKLEAQATEYDKIPDEGGSQKIIKVSELVSNKPMEVILKVTVTENRGRYSGNQAQWEFVFLVSKD